MVGICPNCRHDNFPNHMISGDIKFTDPENGHIEQTTYCTYGDCDCVRHLVKVKGKVNTRQSVSPLVIKS